MVPYLLVTDPEGCVVIADPDGKGTRTVGILCHLRTGLGMSDPQPLSRLLRDDAVIGLPALADRKIR